MAWTSSPKKPPPPPSALTKLVPLIVVFVFLGGLAFVGYHMYLMALKISATTSEKMEQKNVVFTKDGLKVGVKHMKNEDYVDTTQSFLVKAWNLSSFPGYKSRLGWNSTAEGSKKVKK